MTKICTKCGREMDAVMFLYGKLRDKKRSHCHDCQNDMAATWRKQNPDKAAFSKKRWNQANPNMCRLQRQRNRMRHPEARRMRAARYRLRHPEKWQRFIATAKKLPSWVRKKINRDKPRAAARNYKRRQWGRLADSALRNYLKQQHNIKQPTKQEIEICRQRIQMKRAARVATLFNAAARLSKVCRPSVTPSKTAR
jgi:hypothetical protein